MKSKLNPEVFRKANELLVTFHCDFSCVALENSMNKIGVPHTEMGSYEDFFAGLFKPTKDHYIWWNSESEDERHEELRMQRSLALLFAEQLIINPCWPEKI